jgi:hypothetical protein
MSPEKLSRRIDVLQSVIELLVHCGDDALRDRLRSATLEVQQGRHPWLQDVESADGLPEAAAMLQEWLAPDEAEGE